MKYQDVAIKKIRREEITQSRERTDDDVAGEYWRRIREGERFPEPIVFWDRQDYWLADGWHTVRGYELGGCKSVRVEVREGTVSDAILHAAGANAKHGLQRSRADRRRAVLLLLRDEEWRKWSNRQIASHCSVDEGTVRNVRRELANGAAEFPQTATVAKDDWLDDLTPAERAAWDALDSEDRDSLREQAKVDVLDERLLGMEAIIGRMEKRLGEDEFGKAISHDLRLFSLHARSAVGWESVRQTVADDDWRERMLGDLQRLRKLNQEMPGERPRIKILDRLAAKLKAEE